MNPLGIIGGSAFLDGVDLGELARDLRLEEVVTPRGTVHLHWADDFVFLRRHGERGYRPPHRIPHHANVLALEAVGAKRVVALASAGSLRPDLRPGDLVVPEDYLSRHPPPTFAGDEFLHIVPELSAELRSDLLEAGREALGRVGAGGDLHDGGVYAETTGPRFETRAEVRALARDASVVGMTAASEATLCQERGIDYAVACIVDNWAHGVGAEPLTLTAFQARQAGNRSLAHAVIHAVVRNRRKSER